MMWVRMGRLMEASIASRRRKGGKAVDNVLSGVAATINPDTDLFIGVAHPRLLIFVCA